MQESKTFNWSELNRHLLYSMLYGAGRYIVGKKLLVEDVHSVLARHVKYHLPVKVKFERDFKTEEDYVYIGGIYYSTFDKANYPKYIEVVFSYNFFQEYITLSRHKWKRMCKIFSDVILHEIIHMRQFRARNFKLIPVYSSDAAKAKERRSQEYYGDNDEMGAYAFNIACELYDKFGNNFNAIKKYLDSNNYKRNKRTDWFTYMNTFNNNHNHVIIRRMKKKVINQLPNARFGKPFKTNSYLTY